MKPRHMLGAALLSALPLLATADNPGWVTLAPDNAGFSAEFPVAPGYQEQSPQGLTTHMWLAKTADENLMAIVGVTDYWQHVETEEELRLDEKNFLAAFGGVPTTSTRDDYPGPSGQLPAIVFDYTVPSGWAGRSRVIKDGDTVWQYAVMWKQGYDGSAALELFEKSFKLVPRKRPAPPPAATNGN